MGEIETRFLQSQLPHRPYSLPLSSFHVSGPPKPAKGSDNIPREKRVEDLKSCKQFALHEQQCSKRRGYRYNGTKGNGIPQKRANKNLHFAETMKYTQVHSLPRFLEDGVPPPSGFISPLYYLLVILFVSVCTTYVRPAIDWYLVPEIHESREIAVLPMSTMDI